MVQIKDKFYTKLCPTAGEKLYLKIQNELHGILPKVTENCLP